MRLKNQKKSKNFIHLFTSYLPRIYAPSGTFRPTIDEARNGYYNMLNEQFIDLVKKDLAARRIQPGVERYEDFRQPGYSPDLEPFWDENMKKRFRKTKEEYHKKHDR